MKVRAFTMPDTGETGNTNIHAEVRQAAAAYERGTRMPGQGNCTQFKGTPRLAKHDQMVEHGGVTVRVK